MRSRADLIVTPSGGTPRWPPPTCRPRRRRPSGSRVRAASAWDLEEDHPRSCALLSCVARAQLPAVDRAGPARLGSVQGFPCTLLGGTTLPALVQRLHLTHGC